MNKENLSYYIRKFLTHYLVDVLNYSKNTILSYRDTISLFIKYCLSKTSKLEDLNFEILEKQNILDFLSYLEIEKNNSINTRNQRLACIKTLCRYIADEDPTHLIYYQNVNTISFKKKCEKEIKVLTEDEIKHILNKPNTRTKQGKKELTILTLLYDSAIRISELINLKVCDIRFDKISRVLIKRSKNNKSREIPITENTKKILIDYINYFSLNNDSYLFLSNQKKTYSSNGIRKIIKNYTQDIEINVTPHVFRHTKACHLVNTNIPLIYIRDFLGHSSIKTTEIYAKSNGKQKNEAIINHSLELNNEIKYDLKNSELLEWLNNL